MIWMSLQVGVHALLIKVSVSKAMTTLIPPADNEFSMAIRTAYTFMNDLARLWNNNLL